MRIAFLFVCAACLCCAESNCPWMNKATAAGLLGGDVTAKFVSSGKSGESGQCTFTQASNSAIALRIDVALMTSLKTQFPEYLAKCGPNAKPVKAIGNEAVTCTSGHEQTLIGRVRDEAFIITLLSPDDAAKDSIKKAAEIVSGNLF